MIKRIKEWYKSLSSNQRLAIHFCIQWLYWFLVWIVMEKVWPDDEPKTIGSILFTATWMAVWMTTLFEWKKVKALFTRKKTDGK